VIHSYRIAWLYSTDSKPLSFAFELLGIEWLVVFMGLAVVSCGFWRLCPLRFRLHFLTYHELRETDAFGTLRRRFCEKLILAVGICSEENTVCSDRMTFWRGTGTLSLFVQTAGSWPRRWPLTFAISYFGKCLHCTSDYFLKSLKFYPRLAEADVRLKDGYGQMD
jgi:hypothetical protein